MLTSLKSLHMQKLDEDGRSCWGNSDGWPGSLTDPPDCKDGARERLGTWRSWLA